jgi:DNA polymerase-3 subunit chi
VVQKIPGNATAEFQILLNLDDALPSQIAGFGRVIEIVSQDDDDRALARDRFKAYREQGYEMLTHRLGQNE